MCYIHHLGWENERQKDWAVTALSKLKKLIVCCEPPMLKLKRRMRNLLYRSISYKQPESPSLSDRNSQHYSWILSSYLSGIHISDDYITHVYNRYIDCSNTFEQQGDLKILLNRPENRILQNAIWRWFLICSTVGINFQVVYKTFIFIALLGCGVYNVCSVHYWAPWNFVCW